MILIIKKFIIAVVITFLAIITSPSFSFSQMKISDIKNKIYVLDVYGKRFSLDKSKQIKTGDYLKTKKNPAILILNNRTKICLSPNSSIKINSLNLIDDHYEINLDYRKGDMLLSIPKNTKDTHNLFFYSYKVNNLINKIILSKNFKLELLNYNNELNLLFIDKKIKKIPPYSYTKIFEKKNLIEIYNASKVSNFSSKFLQGCVSILPKIKQKVDNSKLQYRCVTENGRLICGNR